jgi:hypothetical protein
MRMSSTRDRFSRVSAMVLGLAPALAIFGDSRGPSRNTRSSSGRASMTRAIMPCSMIA